jgi:hypothetical protein
MVSHYIIFTNLQPQIHTDLNNSNYDMHVLSKRNTAKASYIKHDSPEVKDVCYFADRFWYVLELKKKNLTTIMEKSNNLYESDMTMIRIQALEWVQGKIQDLILDNVTKDWPVYNTK